MNKFIDFFRRHRILKHILIIFAVSIVLLSSVSLFLDAYTRHGETKIVPDLKGLSVDVATTLLEGRGLCCEVVDSIYRRGAAMGCIVEQDPVAEAHVKSDRKIYLIINANSPQMIMVPDAVDMSLRQARAQLEGAGFHIDSVVYKPSEYRDLVLGVYYRNSRVNQGDKLPSESSLYLWVGSGNETGVVEDAQDQEETGEGEESAFDSFEEDIVL